MVALEGLVNVISSVEMKGRNQGVPALPLV